MFVLGFSLVFIFMGASASYIGSFLLSYRSLLNKIAGVLIIVFGLSLIGLFKLPVFQGGGIKTKTKPRGPLSTIVLGMAFAVAWTPCVGPILTAILTYAGSTGTVTTGMALLAVYSLGLGVPFILTGLLFSRFLVAFGWVRKHYGVITTISGLLFSLLTLDSILFTGLLRVVHNSPL